MLDAALANQKRGEKASQLPQAVRFAAGGQQHLAERKILDGPRQSKAELGIAGVNGRQRRIRGKSPPLVVTRDGAGADIFLGNGSIVIVKIVDRAAQVGPRVVDLQQLETPPSDHQNIQAAVGVFAEDTLHRSRAAGIHDTFFIGQQDAEFDLVAQHRGDHFLVTVFKNMQRELGLRQQHYLKRKQRQPSLHVTIMTFLKRVILKLKQTPGIYLVGFMGCGKSTVGSALADELGWVFSDLDKEIEKAADQSITEIFERHGEAAFRAQESEALKKLVKNVRMGRPQVIALGGGAFTIQDNFELAANHGVTIWLDTPLDVIERRIAEETHRPLARDPVRLRALYEDRRAAYERADYRIQTFDHDPGYIVSRILALPLFVP
jgi:shikimate kinase